MKSKKQQKMVKFATEAQKNNKKLHKENEETNKMTLDEEDCANYDNSNPEMKETKENLQYEDDFDDEYEKEDKFEIAESCSDDYESIDDDEGESGMMQESKDKL